MSDARVDLDSRVVADLRELMQEEFSLLVATFSSDADARIQQLQEALQAEDWQALRQAAHSFKGSCGNMGAWRLQQVCLSLEEAAEGHDAALAGQLVDAVPGLLQQVKKQLQCMA